MINKEAEEAVRIGDDKIVTEYIDQLENKVKELGKGQYTLMQSRRKWKNRYYKEKQKRKETDKAVEQTYDDYQNIIQQLKIEYEQLTQSVKRYEEMRRNCQADSFYKKSYQTSIHKLNAKRETISNIIDLLKK